MATRGLPISLGMSQHILTVADVVFFGLILTPPPSHFATLLLSVTSLRSPRLLSCSLKYAVHTPSQRLSTYISLN